MHRRHPSSPRGLAALLLASALVACGVGIEDLRSTQEELAAAPSTLLVGVDLPGDHRVEIYELAPGQIAVRELAPVGTTSRALTGEQLQGMTLAQAYRTLVPSAKDVPPELLAAEQRRQSRSLRDATEPRSASPEAAKPTGSGKKDEVSIQSWEGDWFRANYCSSADVDSVWCVTDIAWANSGTRKTTYFESASGNFSYDATATMWLNVWNCDGGCSWKRISTYTLNPRYVAWWSLEGTAWYQAGVDSNVNTTAFSLRYRDAFPAGFRQTAEYPFDGSFEYTENIQGIAHDWGNWYITRERAAYKIPVGRPLGAWGQYVAATGIPPALGAYTHMGDADFYNGRLYVPMEGSTPAIAVFDSNLNYITHAYIPGAGDAPWCAINPVDGLLYLSSFDGVSQVRKFRMDWSANTLTLTQVGAVDLKDSAGNPISLRRIQGGAFSPKGHLYLVMDVAGHGVKGFEVRSGRQYAEFPINYDPSWDTAEELEGIDIWDLDNGAAPGVNGQIHVLMLDNDWPSADDLYFKHYSLTDPSEKPNL